jgi:protein-S-isoprenylcysteine O-methyltransferase Ste14
MGRIAALIYSALAYFCGVAALLYAIGFVNGLAVPKTIDAGTVKPIAETLAVNLALLLIFALQHSVMARKSFKLWWTKTVPQPIERSTYVLFSALALALLIWQWRPMPEVVWQVGNPTLAMVVQGLSLFGWVFAFASTFMISHFDLFGINQLVGHIVGGNAAEAGLRTPGFYRVVRHPIYFGFLVAFWTAPVMTYGRLLFAAGMTVYILVGVALEERDLVATFGDEYRAYRKRVAMLIPFMRKS